jgi:tRNA threonylcarbamoyladenosine biosynthesis protein TsaB
VTLAGPQPPVGSWLCAGTGFGAYPLLAKRLGVDPGRVAAQLLPRAHEVLAIGRRELAAGRTLAPDAALPIYLRNRVTSVP